MSTDPSQRILGTAYGDDDGRAPAALEAALHAYASGEGAYGDVLEVLATSRVLVPVVAVDGEREVGPHGLVHDKSADMATILLTGADGRQAYLAFTSMATLGAWQTGARPVPVSFGMAARAAIQDGADAVVVDLAGPVQFVVSGEVLVHLAGIR